MPNALMDYLAILNSSPISARTPGFNPQASVPKTPLSVPQQATQQASPQGPGFAFPSQTAQPVASQASPVPKKPSVLDKFVKPETVQFFNGMAANLLSPRQVGETSFQHVANSVLQGYQSLGVLAAIQREAARQQMEDRRKNLELASKMHRNESDITRDAVLNRKTEAETSNIPVEAEQKNAQLTETGRHNKAQEGIEDTKIKSTKEENDRKFQLNIDKFEENRRQFAEELAIKKQAATQKGQEAEANLTNKKEELKLRGEALKINRMRTQAEIEKIKRGLEDGSEDRKMQVNRETAIGAETARMLQIPSSMLMPYDELRQKAIENVKKTSPKLFNEQASSPASTNDNSTGKVEPRDGEIYTYPTGQKVVFSKKGQKWVPVQ